MASVRYTFVHSVGVCAVAFLALPASGDTYLALGDSLAFGYSTFLGTPQGFGDNGYARRFADHLASVDGSRPELLNFAVPGETSGDFAGGAGFGFLYNQNYFDDAIGGADFTQAELLDRALTEHAAGTRTITNVTVQLGVNDLLQLADQPGFFGLSSSEQLTQINATINSAAAVVSGILGDVASIAPAAEVAVMGYYNPFTIIPADPLAPLAEAAAPLLNDALRAAAADAGVSFVDVFDLFVGRESELTRILTRDDLFGEPNIHPTELGYDVLANALIAVPAPGAVSVLACVGVFASGRRR
ncbi:MAG: GDSL-type esterase/lipase family protein [Planctomycetota bacterium]